MSKKARFVLIGPYGEGVGYVGGTVLESYHDILENVCGYLRPGTDLNKRSPAVDQIIHDLISAFGYINHDPGDGWWLTVYVNLGGVPKLPFGQACYQINKDIYPLYNTLSELDTVENSVIVV